MCGPFGLHGHRLAMAPSSTPPLMLGIATVVWFLVSKARDTPGTVVANAAQEPARKLSPAHAQIGLRKYERR